MILKLDWNEIQRDSNVIQKFFKRGLEAVLEAVALIKWKKRGKKSCCDRESISRPPAPLSTALPIELLTHTYEKLGNEWNINLVLRNVEVVLRGMNVLSNHILWIWIILTLFEMHWAILIKLSENLPVDLRNDLARNNFDFGRFSKPIFSDFTDFWQFSRMNGVGYSPKWVFGFAKGTICIYKVWQLGIWTQFGQSLTICSKLEKSLTISTKLDNLDKVGQLTKLDN